MNRKSLPEQATWKNSITIADDNAGWVVSFNVRENVEDGMSCH